MMPRVLPALLVLAAAGAAAQTPPVDRQARAWAASCAACHATGQAIPRNRLVLTGDGATGTGRATVTRPVPELLHVVRRDRMLAVDRRGLLFGDGPDLAGEIEVVDIGLDVDRAFLFASDEDEAARLDEDQDDDLLVVSRAFNLIDLLEDELILALPIFGAHGEGAYNYALTLGEALQRRWAVLKTPPHAGDAHAARVTQNELGGARGGWRRESGTARSTRERASRAAVPTIRAATTLGLVAFALDGEGVDEPWSARSANLQAPVGELPVMSPVPNLAHSVQSLATASIRRGLVRRAACPVIEAKEA